MAKMDVRLPDGLKAALEERAVLEGRSAASVVRIALLAFLNPPEYGVAPLARPPLLNVKAVIVDGDEVLAEPLGPSVPLAEAGGATPDVTMGESESLPPSASGGKVFKGPDPRSKGGG